MRFVAFLFCLYLNWLKKRVKVFEILNLEQKYNDQEIKNPPGI